MTMPRVGPWSASTNYSHLLTATRLSLHMRADYSGWVNTFSDGSYCRDGTRISYMTGTIAACKAVCRSTVGCGAIYTDAVGTQVGNCQLFPLSACALPTGFSGNPDGKIFLAAGELYGNAPPSASNIDASSPWERGDCSLRG